MEENSFLDGRGFVAPPGPEMAGMGPSSLAFLEADGGGITTPMTVLLGAQVYSPTPLGSMDILLGGTRILAMAPTVPGQLPNFISDPSLVTYINVTGSVVTPGIIDVHIHVTGGGGELGPYSRTPEAELSQLINGGVTTLIGLLGTDSVSRSLPNLLVKLEALEQYGLTTFMYTGGYRVPPPTLTESVMTDIILIDKIIGVGEIGESGPYSRAFSLPLRRYTDSSPPKPSRTLVRVVRRLMS
jgi:isoaspartyl dipeptidase IadA